MPTAMPMSSTTVEVCEPTGSQCPGMASSQVAVSAAVMASSTGMLAATSVPNTMASRMRVSGSDVSAALPKSLLIWLLIACPRLASPPSATSRPGWLACTEATADSAGVTAVVTSAAGPGTVKVTSALRPLAETSAWPPGLSGELIPVAAAGSRDSAATTWLTAWRIAGSVANVAPGVRAWISTSSDVGVATPRCCRVCSACPAWPRSFCGRLGAPSSWPMR